MFSSNNQSYITERKCSSLKKMTDCDFHHNPSLTYFHLSLCRNYLWTSSLAFLSLVVREKDNPSPTPPDCSLLQCTCCLSAPELALPVAKLSMGTNCHPDLFVPSVQPWIVIIYKFVWTHPLLNQSVHRFGKKVAWYNLFITDWDAR